MAQLLPLPPTNVQIFDPQTGWLTIQGQNYFNALNEVLATFAGAPNDAQYWVSAANGSLTNETDLGALTTGYVKITVAAAIAVPSAVATIPFSDVSTLNGSTYMPTLTSVANVTSSTPHVCQFLRVGNTVTVSGKLDVQPTAMLTLTQLGISLPITSTLAAQEQCAGVAVTPSIAGDCAAILADTMNHRAEMDWTTTADVASRSWYFSFTYRVL